MNFTILFLLLYLVGLLLGKKIKLPSVITTATVLLLIFTVSYWGGEEVTANTAVKILVMSTALALSLTLITYLLGLFFVDKVQNLLVKGNWKMQIKYLTPLILGLVVGVVLKFDLPFDEIIDYELYALALIIGVEVGRGLNLDLLKRTKGLAVFSILIDILGGVVIAFLFSFFMPLKASLMIALGSGWYSYTGPFVAKYYGPTLGVIGFLANFLREQLTFALLPILLRIKPTPIGAIAVGGATSMDVTLPLYVDLFGGEYAIGAMINGLILTLLVPVILPVIAIL